MAKNDVAGSPLVGRPDQHSPLRSKHTQGNKGLYSEPAPLRSQEIYGLALAGRWQHPRFPQAWPRPGLSPSPTPTPPPGHPGVHWGWEWHVWPQASCAEWWGPSFHAHSLAQQDIGCKPDPSPASSAHPGLLPARLPPRAQAAFP